MSDPAPASRQNVILRDYFRAYFASVHSNEWDSIPEPMLEKYIDVRIDDFLKRLRKSLDELLVYAQELRQAHADLAGGSQADEATHRLRLKRALSRVEDECSRLRRMLARVLTDLKSKNGQNVSLSKQDPFFHMEVSTILTSVEKAADRIEDYFFLSQPTVHILGLQNENMLIYLWQAQQMAKAVGSFL